MERESREPLCDGGVASIESAVEKGGRKGEREGRKDRERKGTLSEFLF